MRKWRVEIIWECELEAEDEGAALIYASSSFDFMDWARAEEITPEAKESTDAN